MTTAPAPQQIRVRQCTVRVRRRGGWSWGDPAAYVDAVVAATEQALAALVAEAGLDETTDLAVTAPLTLEIGADGHPTPASMSVAAGALRAAAAATRSGAAGATRADGQADRPRVPAGADEAPAQVDDDQVVALAGTLGRWSRSGTLRSVLATWPPAVLEAWVAAVHAGARSPAGRIAALAPTVIASIAGCVLAGPPGRGEDDSRRRFLLLTGAVAAALGGRSLPDPETLAAVADAAGLAPVSASAAATRATVDGPTDVRTRQAPSAAEPTSRPDPPRAAVVPALPFLVLVQLHRLGYVDPATAALAAAGVAPAAPSFAAATAGAVLDPPAHGWRRTPEQRRAVELSSGLGADEVDTALGAVAERTALLHAPLRASLAELYAAGRASVDPLELTRAGDDLVCGEARGALPLAWCGSRTELATVLDAVGRPPVLETDRFTPLAAALHDHRAFPGRTVPDLERVLRAVVGTALGSLALELWGEDADALLALTRLRGLEARVEVGDRVRVGLPRGQRWLDLRRVGLLDTWPVPWAAGGLWELVTW
jgi:hypothetical protein